MTYLLIFSCALAVISWIKGRPNGFLLPSDAFFLLFVILMAVAPILNPTAYSPLAANFRFSSEIAYRAMLGICLAFWVFAIVWLIRPKLDGTALWTSTRKHFYSDFQAVNPKYIRAMLFGIFGISLVLLVSTEARNYRFEIISFVTGQLSSEEYRHARRLTYADSFLISDFIGKLRYSLFPPMFCIVVSYISFKNGFKISAPLAIIIFLLFPASLSKLPFAIYFLYTSIIYLFMYNKMWVFNGKTFAITSVSAVFFVILFISFMYFFQYPAIFSTISDFPKAFDLATYRILLNLYAGYLAHIKIYPDQFGFTGLSSIGSFSFLTGQTRIIDLEVAQAFVGLQNARYTSFPTTYIGAAYASFGYFGIIIFSAIVSVYLAAIDVITFKIENTFIRLNYLAVMIINVTFFDHLPAPPVFLTYGLIIIPVFFWWFDRFIRLSGYAMKHRERLSFSKK